MSEPQPKRILLAVLNWGLGHATRCVPLVDYWQSKGYQITLASDGSALQYLRHRYPALPFLQLPTLEIHYSSRLPAWWMIGLQSAQLVRHRKADHKALERHLARNPVDWIVSDNRYGCWSKDVRSVLLTHQLNPAMPRGLNGLGPVIYSRLQSWIRHFDQIWVPDVEVDSISGKLSHTKKSKRIATRFIGPLSRLYTDPSKEKDITALALISGPEPQRSIFERTLAAQFKKLSGHKVIIGGRLNGTLKANAGMEYIPFIDGETLARLLTKSKLVVARSGYSSLMDLIRLGIPALLVPTPGQTEQEYLANRVNKLFGFLWQPQGKLDISLALAELEQRNFNVPKGIKNAFNKTHLIDPLEQVDVPS